MKKSKINFTQLVLITILIVIASFATYMVIIPNELSGNQVLMRLGLIVIITSMSGFLIEKLENNDFITRFGNKFEKK